jgi:hypothetical protein
LSNVDKKSYRTTTTTEIFFSLASLSYFGVFQHFFGNGGIASAELTLAGGTKVGKKYFVMRDKLLQKGTG